MNNLTIRLAELPQDLPQLYKIRHLVFQVEQGVDPTLEFDGKDEQAEHILACLDGEPVGTARMRFLGTGTAKIERVAVLENVRKLGIGRRLMEYMLEFLSERQIVTVVMNAQQTVQGFYQKLGFEPEGEGFEEAGILHIRMKKVLR